MARKKITEMSVKYSTFRVSSAVENNNLHNSVCVTHYYYNVLWYIRN